MKELHNTTLLMRHRRMVYLYTPHGRVLRIEIAIRSPRARRVITVNATCLPHDRSVRCRSAVGKRTDLRGNAFGRTRIVLKTP